MKRREKNLAKIRMGKQEPEAYLIHNPVLRKYFEGERRKRESLEGRVGLLEELLEGVTLTKGDWWRMKREYRKLMLEDDGHGEE